MGLLHLHNEHTEQEHITLKLNGVVGVALNLLLTRYIWLLVLALVALSSQHNNHDDNESKKQQSSSDSTGDGADCGGSAARRGRGWVDQ